MGSDWGGRAGIESVEMNWGNEVFCGSMRDIQQKVSGVRRINRRLDSMSRRAWNVEIWCVSSANLWSY